MNARDLHNQAEELLRRQLEEWPLAGANYAALGGVRVRTFDVGGMPVKVQFNPARIVSTGAKVDAASVKARPCFLCAGNRPGQQHGVAWRDYELLVNPFPIFPKHFTIPFNGHVAQRISGRIGDMMRLARELDGYTVFYNGPRCGASAPDHMHFQAGNTDFLTLPSVLEHRQLTAVAGIGGAQLSDVPELPLGVLVMDVTDIADGERVFAAVYDALPRPSEEEEPMMNLLCYSRGSGVRLIVIPRTKHRPSFYGAEGEGTMLISPASVDLGGVFITPLEKDFDTLDAGKVEALLDQVCITAEQVSALSEIIKNHINR